MSIRIIASIVLALVFGVVAVLMVHGYVAGAQTPATGAPVVVAAQPIPFGATLNASMLKVAIYPANSVPVGGFRTIGQLTGAPHAMLRQIALNEPVLGSALSGPGGHAHLSSRLDPGARAVTIRSTDVSGVGGFALPGDRVDVMATRTTGAGDTASAVTQVLAENVLVLGVDQTDDKSGVKPIVAKAITLQVTPEQAQAISLVQSIGVVTLSLRQFGDSRALSRTETTIADLAHGEPVRAAAARPAHHLVPRHAAVAEVGPQVQVTRGTGSSGYAVGKF